MDSLHDALINEGVNAESMTIVDRDDATSLISSADVEYSHANPRQGGRLVAVDSRHRFCIDSFIDQIIVQSIHFFF